MSILFLIILTLLAPTQSADNPIRLLARPTVHNGIRMMFITCNDLHVELFKKFTTLLYRRFNLR